MTMKQRVFPKKFVFVGVTKDFLLLLRTPLTHYCYLVQFSPPPFIYAPTSSSCPIRYITASKLQFLTSFVPFSMQFTFFYIL